MRGDSDNPGEWQETNENLGDSWLLGVSTPTCRASCVSPNLSALDVRANCATNTADLSLITVSGLPVGTILTWHTGAVASAANGISDISNVAPGTYYAAIYDAYGECYGETIPVTVTKTFCISGNVYNDGNGLKDGLVSQNAGWGSPMIPSALFVNLIDTDGKVFKTSALNYTAGSGNYLFTDLEPGAYSVQISQTAGVPGQFSSSSSLPDAIPQWINVGEQLGTIANAGLDTGNPDGVMTVNITATSLTNINFGLNRKPITYDVTAPAVSNAGTALIVPTLIGMDAEDRPVSSTLLARPVIIVSLPESGTLYYQGSLVTEGQRIASYNPSLLTVIPNSTATNILFDYSYEDIAETISDPNTVLIPLTYTISGRIWIDENADAIVDASENAAIPSGLTAYLIDEENKVIQTYPLGSGQTYDFNNVLGGNTYGVLVSNLSHVIGSEITASQLPASYAHTGVNTVNVPNTQNKSGSISIQELRTHTINLNFGIKNTNPLPVTLMDISAKTVENNSILLRWITAAEIDFDHFEIEKSFTPSKGFEFLASIHTHDRLYEGSYHYVDRDLIVIKPNNICYYRLKMVDKDGSYAYSRIVSAKIEDPLEVIVYPNPAGKTISITNLSGLGSNLTVELFNSTGKKVLSEIFNPNENNISVSNLPAGLYLLKVVGDQGFRVQKFIKD